MRIVQVRSPCFMVPLVPKIESFWNYLWCFPETKQQRFLEWKSQIPLFYGHEDAKNRCISAYSWGSPLCWGRKVVAMPNPKIFKHAHCSSRNRLFSSSGVAANRRFSASLRGPYDAKNLRFLPYSSGMPLFHGVADAENRKFLAPFLGFHWSRKPKIVGMHIADSFHDPDGANAEKLRFLSSCSKILWCRNPQFSGILIADLPISWSFIHQRSSAFSGKTCWARKKLGSIHYF